MFEYNLKIEKKNVLSLVKDDCRTSLSSHKSQESLFKPKLYEDPTKTFLIDLLIDMQFGIRLMDLNETIIQRWSKERHPPVQSHIVYCIRWIFELLLLQELGAFEEKYQNKK